MNLESAQVATTLDISWPDKITILLLCETICNFQLLGKKWFKFRLYVH